MADPTELQSSLSTKLLGSDSSGIESNYIGARSTGDIKAADILDVSAGSTTLALTTSESIARLSGSNLTNRKTILIENLSDDDIEYGFTSGTRPHLLSSGEWRVISIGPNINLYVAMTTGTGNLAVSELS